MSEDTNVAELEPELQKILPLLSSLRIEENGPAVTARFAVPIDVIFEIMQAMHGDHGGAHEHKEAKQHEEPVKGRRRPL